MFETYLGVSLLDFDWEVLEEFAGRGGGLSLGPAMRGALDSLARRGLIAGDGVTDRGRDALRERAEMRGNALRPLGAIDIV